MTTNSELPASAVAGKAALWTDSAKQEHARLKALPDSHKTGSVRMQIGYLEEAKNAAEGA
ncbi:hypothetical protein AB4Y77_00080 [Paenarthrobacter sp. YAF11_1]|uniref:hypothetical protein n=1 Tax=Paenarthrobacter sp. YAF11_1 TaxID=3233074 RepID=UPI003F9AFB7F